MNVKITDLKNSLISALTVRGLDKNEAEMVAEPFLEAELSGKKTHGISKFLLIDEAIRQREGAPEIIKDKFNYALIDGHKELGCITAQFASDLLIKKAQQFESAIVATKNSYYYSIAGIYARKVAEAGFISIMMNNGGPAAVAPFGGVDPIFGTNPIAIGIPYKKGAIVLDMATAKRVWGEVNLAKVEGRELESGTFFDTAGKMTTDPQQANAIKGFGDAKGSGLNFMFEILTGAFVGAKMGLQSQHAYDLGFLFLAYSPEMFTTRDLFDQQVEQLIAEMKNSKSEIEGGEIFLPGEKSVRNSEQALQRGYIEVVDSVWSNLTTFCTGGDVKV